MDPIEQRVRDSLRARARDAEPTPHLYRGVQDRIARRRRQKLLAWVPAGAAALGVAVAIPFLLTGGPEVPRIDDYADLAPPPTAITPDRAVIVDAEGHFELLDLTDGSSTAPYGRGEYGPQPRIAVAPSERGAVPVVHVAVPWTRSDGDVLALGHVDRTGGSIAASLGPAVSGGGFAISPDGRWTATLTDQMEHADGWVLEVRPSIDPDETHTGGGVSVYQPGVEVPEGSVVQDWTGSLAPGGESELTILQPGGSLVGFPLVVSPEAEGGFLHHLWWDFDVTTDPVGRREVTAFASSHLDASTGYVLETAGDGAYLQAVDGEEVLGRVDVSELVGGQDPATFALDAWGDTAALSTPEGSWLLRHDGEGDFVQPVALPDGTVRAALIGKDVAAAPADEDPQPDGSADDGDVEEVPDGEPTPPTGPADHPGTLGDGVVVADATTVWVVEPEGLRDELVTFPAEGESTVVAVAVRPGSTADDLTVAITTRAEGQFDVRWLRVVDGQVDTTIDPVGTDFPAPPVEGAGGFPFTAPDLQDGGEMAAAWSPDGDLLAVVARPSEGGPAELRTIGWTDEGPSGDPNLAAAIELGTDRPLTARQWTWADDAGGGTAREGALIVIDEAAREAFTIRLDRQGDGAPAMPNQNPLQRIPEDGVLDLVDADGDGTFDTMLRSVGGPWPILELRTSEGGGEMVSGVEIDAGGPGDVGSLAAWGEVLLVVTDPAQPVLVDRATGEVVPALLGIDVVSADVIR